MSNKYIKLTSKRRERPKASYVQFEGVQMTAIEREALLRKRAAERRRMEALKPAPKPSITKGQIVEPPALRPVTNAPKNKKPGLFQRVFGRKKKQKSSPPAMESRTPAVSKEKEEAPVSVIVQSKATDAEMKTDQVISVMEEPATVAAPSPATEAVEDKEIAVQQKPDSDVHPEKQETDAPVEAQAAVHEAMAIEKAVEATSTATDPAQTDEGLVEEQLQEDASAAEEVVQLYQKLKRVPKLELLRFARQTAAGADKAILEHKDIVSQLEAKEAELKAAKTPKDATEEQRKLLNSQRAALRKERDGLKRKGLIAYEKAISLERASDEYAAVASWLLEKEVRYRKQPRLNPVDSNLSENIIPLSERVAHSSIPGVSKERIEELKESL